MPMPRKMCAGIPQRWIIIFTCFLGSLNVCNVQICLSIAITAMVTPKNHTTIFNNDTCPSETTDVPPYRNESFVKGKTFDWDEETQGQILSSFYWGTIITCLLGGSILDKFGGKGTMTISTLSTSLLTLLIPKSIGLHGATSLIGMRFLTGLGAGMMNPAIMRLMSRWIPPQERSWAATWAFSGGAVGFVLGTGASGAIIRRSEDGWPTMFYVYGVLGLVVFGVQCALCYDSPSLHPFVSEAEVELLKKKIKHSHSDIPPTPWYHIVRSKPLWALLIALIGNAWCHVTIASDIPKFTSSVLKFNVETNGYVSSIPYVSSWIVSCTLSWICDRLIVNKIASTACIRKFSNSVTMLGAGLFLVVSTYVGCDKTLVVALQVLAVTSYGCINFGTLINALDLAPNYAGAIQGILFGVCMGVGLMSPYVAGWLTPNQTIDEWRTVFWLIFVIGAVTNVVFVIFGGAEVQRWNEPDFLRGGKDGKGDDVEENMVLVVKKMQNKSIA